MKCPRCDGTGYTYIEYPVFDPKQEQYYPDWDEVPCDYCGGTGEYIPDSFLSLLNMTREEIEIFFFLDEELNSPSN